MLEVSILAVVFGYLVFGESGQLLDVVVMILQTAMLALKSDFKLVNLLRPNILDTSSD